MRLALAILAPLWAVCAYPSYGDTTFPYKAYINGDEVYVRSGPGQSYYPTDKLKAGAEVEVYRHDPGGWFAIRPLKGSFSWVSGKFVEPGRDNLAVVNADGVASRIGSRFSDIRDVIQIRLHKGEVVEVLDSRQSGSQTWYKIAPPSGEFRWVAGKFVDPDYPKDGVRKTPAAVPPNGASGQKTDPVEPPPFFESPPPFESPRDADRSEDTPRADAGRPGRDATSFRIDVAPPDAVDPPPPTDEEKPSAVYRAMSPEEYQAELEDLDLKLSTMVAEEPTVWSFDAMRQRAREMHDLAETAVERGRARLLMNKLAQFADIKKRYVAMAASHENVERAGEKLASLHPEKDAAQGADPSGDQFDGSGQLTRVASPAAGAPRYALLDDGGQVRCYVSPVPGVDLGRYLGRRIGVTGNRGFVLDQQTPHVMARHVSLLEGRMN